MKIVPTLLMAAVMAGPVHAQVCSGGDGGGIDATGNQCNTPHDVTASTTGSRISLTAPAAKAGGVHARVPAANSPVRSASMSGQLSASTLGGENASRMIRIASPAIASVKTAKVENWSEEQCSGGAGGGMDVNGNQCGEALEVAGVSLVAQQKVR